MYNKTLMRDWNGVEYSIMSRPNRNKKEDCEPINFGDLLSEFAARYGLVGASSFIKLNIAGRDPKYKGSTDSRRKAFLDFMIARKILLSTKVGSEKGYELVDTPKLNDIQLAYEFSNSQSENGKGFAAFEEGDPNRVSTMKTSIKLETNLINTFLASYGYNQLDTEYQLDNFENDFKKLFTEVKVNKLINWLTIKGVFKLRFEFSDESYNDLTGRYIKIMRNIDPIDMDNIPREVFIPSNCNNVTKTVKKETEYFENQEDLFDFFQRNISYLISKDKFNSTY